MFSNEYNNNGVHCNVQNNFNVIESVRREALRRGMSPRTIKSYLHCLNKFFRFYHYKDHRRITKVDIQNFLDDMIDRNKASSTVNLYLMSLKFLYEQILRKRLTVNIKTSKTPSRLPEYLTQDETKRLFEVIDNKKHLLIVKFLYGAGMRVSELVNLKVKDFEFEQNYGWVRQGKGAKDRPFVIAQSLKDELFDWIEKNSLEPHNYLFAGRCGRNVHYTQQSIRIIIKQARAKAKIGKNVHPHTLRHSFATHFIENGQTVNKLQAILGHNSINTTMKYVHMAAPNIINAQSPLDIL
ncbi:MAG: tyrosine-type recombinase/integrase [archaeon]|nr:tyrosine-type recombinase/integrase [Nanoarchaeota archaeon]